MKLSRLKISTKVALLFIVLVLFQGAITLVTLTVIVSRSQNEAFETQLERTVEGIDAYLDEILKEQTVSANLLSGQAKIIDYTDFRLRNLLVRELSLYRSSLRMSSIAVYLASDETLAWVGENPERVEVPEDRVDQAFDGDEQLVMTSGLDHATLTVLTPISREDSRIGVLSVSRRLDERFVERLQTFTDSTIVLAVGDYAVAAEELRAGTIRGLSELRPNSDSSNGTSRIGSVLVGSISLADFGKADARLFTLLDTSDNRRLIARYNQIGAAMTLLTLTLALALGFVFYRATFRTPFRRLLEAVHRISAGEFQQGFTVPSNDEFGDLARAFNTMQRNLVHRERELRQLSVYNALILDNVPVGIVTINRRRVVTSANSEAVRILSLSGEEIVGVPLSAGYLPPGFISMINEALENDTAVNDQEISTVVAGHDTILRVKTTPLISKDRDKIGTIAIFEDVTKLRGLERRLAISNRLAALGEMAAGVAHQIRNPLGVMKVSAEMLRDDFTVTDSGESFDRITHMIVSEIDTLNLVIYNLLDFARPKEAQLEPYPVHAVIQAALDKLPTDNFPGTSVELSGVDEVGTHPLDPSLMEQVVSNLVLNALQASPEGGTVRISAWREGKTLYLEVRDWGEGMPESKQGHVFNPFYTTKPTGTGLGLSIAHQIVEQHNGTMVVSSELGEGTAFTIAL